MNNQRRIFLKGSAAAGTLGVALSAGLLTPAVVLAEWPKAAFEIKDAVGSVKALLGDATAEESADIKIKAPEIAENGAVVPVSITSSIANTESITLVAANNPAPLIASFTMGATTAGFASTRIKMGKTGPVIAYVKAGGKLYSASKEVKVTIGGCGG